MMNRFFNAFNELPKPDFLEKLPQVESLKKLAPQVPFLMSELFNAKKDVLADKMPLEMAKKHGLRLVVIAVEIVFNHHIYQQKALQHEREQLNGKSLRIFIHEVGQPISLVFNQTGVDILIDSDYQVDCTLSTSFKTLKQIKDKTVLTELIKTQQLDVEGDITVLQQLNQLIDKLEPGVGAILSPFIGDLAASVIDSVLSKLFVLFSKKADVLKSCVDGVKKNRPF